MKSILRMLCVVGLMALSAMQGEMVAVAATANYTVNHWLQNIENDDYTQTATTTKTGTVGKSVTAATNTYNGFVTPTKQKFTLNSDTTINYYYDRKTYSVTFEVNGNSMQNLLRYEAVPTYIGSTDKEPDVDSTYAFTGWFSSVDSLVYTAATMPKVTETVVYTAQYSKAIRQYTVRFLVDGYEKESKLVNYGQTPTYIGSTPEKHQKHIGNPQEEYKFTKWLCSVDGKAYATNALPAVKCDQDYNALFDVEINDVICSNSLPYIWVLDGKEYPLNAAGSTTRTFNDGNSKAIMHLTVNPVSHKMDSVASICSGESFYFGGRQLTQKGTYHDTLFAANSKGCDSIIVLTLTVNPTPTMAITGVEYVGKNGHVDQVIVSYNVTAATLFDYTINDKEVKGESVNSKHAFTLDVKDLVIGRNVITAKAKTAACESTTAEFTFEVQYQHPQETIYIVGKTDKMVYDTHITEAGEVHNEYYKIESSKLCFYEVDLDVKDIKTFENEHSSIVTVEATNTAADGYIHYCDRTIDQDIELPWGTFHIEAVADTSKTEMEVEYHGTNDNGDWYDGKVFVTYKTAKVLFRDTVLIASRPEDFPIEFQGKQYGIPENFQPNKAWESKIGQYEPVCINKSLEAETSDLPPHPAPHRASASVPVDLVYNIVVRYTPAASQTTITELGICKGDTLKYNDLDITKTGVYFDTLKNEIGADSIIMLIVNEYQTYDFHEYKTLHNNESWVWEGHKNPQTDAYWEVSETGLYVDAYKTINGCDSVYTLHVTKVPMWVVNTDSVVCENELPIEWRGRLLYEGAEITDDIHYGVDADTTYTLNLKVNKVARHYIEQQVCNGETYTRNGVEYTKPGLYIDTLTTINGCDSIVTLHLTWSSIEMVEEEKVLNGSASYEWHGELRDHTGVYYDSIISKVHGCDSIIYKLTLTINPTYKIDTTVNICETELPYIWQGGEYYNTGVYEKLYQTVAGADSLLTLHLTVNQTAFTSLNLFVCEGDSFTMGDSVWKEPGIYYDTLITTHGCDSIVQVIINRGNSYHFEEIRTIYSGETIEWHGQTIQNEGIFVDNQKSVTGCDSTYTLTVTKLPTIETIEYDTICYSEAPKVWGGRNLFTTGTYTDTLYEAGSTLNIKTLYLTVNQIGISEQERFICKGESYPFFDQILTTAGTYEHHLLTAHGCDSTIILHLNVMNGYEFNEEKTISDKQLPYHWQGRDLYTGGEHVAEYKTMHEACDSIYRLTLTVLPTYADTVRKTVCANELPFEWEGTKYYTAGEFDKYYQTVVGKQDSTIHLSLTVSGSEVVTKSVQLCPGSFFELNGKHITTPGIYDDTIPNMLGCDSITRYVVNFAPLQFHETNASVCKGSTYNWEHAGINIVVDRQGTYLDTIRSKSGCDSIIYRLKLTLVEPFYQRDVDTICESEAISYNYRGQYLPSTIPGTYHLLDQYNTINGCDSTYEMIVTVRAQEMTAERPIHLCEGESYTTVSGKVLNTNCEWNDTINGKTCCDSILHYVVSVHPKYETTETVALCGGDVYDWEGEAIAQAGTYTKTYQSEFGCDSVRILIATQAPAYSFTEEAKVTKDMLPYVWHDQQCWETNTYEDHHYTTAGCDSTYTLNLTVLPWHESAEEVLYLCGDESITINGVTYSEAGHYSQKMYRAGEIIADSIYRFELKKVPTYMSYDSIVVCDSEFENGGIAYIYKDQTSGQSFTITEKKDSVYQFHFETIYGCDSVVELHFGYRPIKVTNQVIEICEGDYYQFRGTKYTSTCSFSDTLKTIDGCDSITRYHLNVKASPTIVETDTIDNNSSSVIWHGHKNDTIITKPGLYTDRIVGQNGCDITYKLIVFKREGIANSETVTICENQKPYVWENHNMSFNQSGIYFDSLTSKIDGSDSIFVLNLTILPTDTVWEEKQICQGETIEFHGKDLTTGGHYTYLDSAGCGTFYILDLLVNRTYSYTKKDYICENDLPYEWRGQEYSVSGTYEDRYTTINGCDSIYTLELTVWPTPAPTMVNKTLCHGDYLDIHGKHITVAGLYDDTLRTIHGCDSIVRYNIQYTTYQQKYDSASINHGETYTWEANQQVYHESGDYEYIVKSKVNQTCDSIVYHLHLVVDNFVKLNICQGDEFQFRGQSHIITENTIFTDTLYDDHGNKTVQKYILNVWPSYHFTEYRSLCGNEYMEWHGQILHQGGVYFDKQQTAHGCDSIYEIHITVDSIYNQVTDTLITPEELPFTWRGRRFWTETEEVDSFRTVAGCDSLFTLNLMLCKKYNTPIDTFQMCKGTSIVISGHEYTQGGLYKLQYASATSGNRPDSIYRFFIQEMEGYYAYDSIRVRESEFTNGIVYNYKGLLNITSKKDSVYKIKTSTEQGCDSIIELHFGVLRAKYETVSMNVCAGSLVWYHNSWNRVEESAIIEDKLYTSQGGDSIVTIIINIIEKPMTEHEIRLCNNDTFKISRVGGLKPLLITEPGIYLDTLTSRDGCDSIVKYIANRAESYFIERYDSIAKNGTYEWHGLIINQPGVYWDSARTVYGCDSIYKLTLTGIAQAQQTYSVKLCSGDSIILRDDFGKSYIVTEPGVYYEKLWSIETGEQDSLIRYIVNVALNYTVNDTAIIERGETYNWFDQTLTIAGDYRHESKTIDGCDSIVNLHLIIDNTYRSEEKIVICYEERPYIWRGMQFYESGNYKDSVHMDAVGDSIFYLDLTVRPEIEKTLVEAKLCYGDVLYVRDQKIDKAGTYYDTLTSKITGCDSIIQYIVNEYPTFQYEETRVMCNGSSITWRGKTFTHEGIYWDSLQTVHGCDSLFKLTVINSNNFALDTTIVWCWDDLPYRHFNGYYNTYYDVKDFPQGSRTFIDTLVASNGCDSITRTHVILTNKCNRDLDTIYYCHGQEYPNIIGGQAIDHEGVYYFNQWTFDGYSAKLDSVHRAIAIEARTYHFYESYTACQGDMTEAHDEFIPGSYPVGQRTIDLYYKTILGCDSIYTINLTVNPSYKNFVSDWQMRDIDVNQLTYTDHDGNPVTFTIDGSQYPAGQNNINLVTYTSTGCEESFNLTLTVVPTTYETDSVRICYLNLPYTYQDFDEQSGTMVSKDAYNEGVYVSHYYRPGGNVSTVKTITLYVDSETTLETAQANPACQQEKYDTPKMVIDFTYSGSKPTEYDLVFSRNAISEGFVNVYGGKVTKNDQIEVKWPTPKQTDQYVRPDDYYVDLTLTNGACGTSAQNTIRLPFTVLYPAWITESLFDHTIAILNENHNGGYIFSNYSWFVNGSYVPTDKPYIYDPNGTIISDGDWYHVELTRMGETYSIPTCEKQYIPGAPVTGRPHLVKAATGNQNAAPIRMKAYGDGTYYIYSHTGQFCGSGEFHQGEQDILLPEIKGCYIIRMQQTNGESNSEKAMIF